MRRQAGFTLIEIIAATVLLGFVAVFGGFFMASGMRGSIMARQSQENSLKGQIALSRIAIELRDVNGGAAVGSAPRVLSGSSIQYTSSASAFSGTVRTLSYSQNLGAITLTPTSGGTAYTLVDGVSSCTMSYSGTGANNDVTLTVVFTLTNSAGNYSVTVKPRNSIPTPVTT